MKKLINLITILFVFSFPIFSGCKNKISRTPDTYKNGQRVISFSGYEWAVAKSAANQGPGPFLYSDSKENVWLDKVDKLHLRITHRNGRWYCAKVTLMKSYSYGRYIFQVDSRVDNFDKNVVGGLFIYKNDTQEIDIEFSKWNIDGNMDAQYAIQPSTKSSNKKRFFIDLAGDKSTHSFNWQSDRIDFASYKGLSTDTSTTNNIIQKWVYTGTDIPHDSDEKAKINLWLFRGNPPSDLKETEMVISGFSIL